LETKLTSDQPSLTLLAQETILTLHGPDAVTFLQGQTTADISNLPTLGCTGGAFCDPKGRVLCDFLALKVEPEVVLLRVHTSVAAQLESHLQKFLLFSKAALGRDPKHVYGLNATPLPDLVQADQQSSIISVIEYGEGYLLPRAANLYEYWGCETDVSQLAGKLTCCLHSDASEWYQGCVERGEARITEATWGKYLPQDLNYDLRGWINFKKGCYTGQEVIARLHWRGTPKRRLYYGRINTATHSEDASPLSEGCTITNNEGKTCGSVVNIVKRENGDHLLFEATKAAECDELRIDNSPTFVHAVRPFF